MLVIDDEPDALEVVRHLLQACGARTLTAANAKEGLLLLQKDCPDVIINDIGMPNIDGYELIRCIRALDNKRNSNVPAIALSAFTRREDQEHAFEVGFNAYLAKPIEPSELVKKILDVARHGQTANP